MRKEVSLLFVLASFGSVLSLTPCENFDRTNNNRCFGVSCGSNTQCQSGLCFPNATCGDCVNSDNAPANRCDGNKCSMNNQCKLNLCFESFCDVNRSRNWKDNSSDPGVLVAIILSCVFGVLFFISVGIIRNLCRKKKKMEMEQ